MKFSATIVAVFAASSAVTEVSAFGVQNLAVHRSTFASTTTTRMALDDLEAKLLSDKDKSAPKRSKPAREKKEKKVKKAAPAPTPEPTPEPVAETKPAKKGRKSKRAKKSEYDLSGVDEVAPPRPAPVKRAARISPRPAPVKKERPVRANPFARKAKAVAAPKKDTVKDPNAGTVGVALGAAPLLLAPVVALSAARSALGKTAARRQAIQDGIAAKEAAAKAKADISADVDGGGVFAALVSNSYKILHW